MSRNIRKLKRAFDDALDPRLRDRIKAQIDAAERATSIAERLTGQRKKNERAQELVDRAEEIKERAKQKRQREEADRKKREPERVKMPTSDRTACTCRKPILDRNGKCRRCRQRPASRKRGFWS